MNLINMILRVMSVFGERPDEKKLMNSKTWASPLPAIERMARIVKIMIVKPAAMFRGFYKSMKRCV